MAKRLSRTGLGGAAVLAASLSAPAQAKPATMKCPEKAVAGGCEGPKECLYPHWDPSMYWQCDASGAAKRMPCPKQLWWNNNDKMCDHTDSTTSSQTAMTVVGNATLRTGTKQVVGLKVDLGLVNQVVVFTSMTGLMLCQATTGEDGVAACNSKAGLVADVATLQRGFKATFAGKPERKLEPRSVQGQVKPG